MSVVVKKYLDFEVFILPIIISSYIGINYIFVIRTFKNGKVICVDPGHAKTVENFLEERGLKLDYILITHKHADHIGGVKNLKDKYGCKVLVFQDDCKMVAGGNVFINLDEEFLGKNLVNQDVSRETIGFKLGRTSSDALEVVDLESSVSRETFERDKELTIGSMFKIDTICFKAVATFGHCANHISYFLEKEKLLFCGDTLFSSGCGRVHGDGSFEELFNSLNKIKNLPSETHIYPAHEYTANNIEFGLTIEPENKELSKKKIWCKALRDEEKPTIPTSVENEQKTNVFLRCKDLKEFERLRRAKDCF